jgi:hypothetical protein
MAPFSIGIEAHRIVAYTFDAAYHCVEHTEKRFGKEQGKNWVTENATDSEGDPVHPVFSVDLDVRTVETCDDEIAELICLCCGTTDKYRGIGADCWNCGEEWRTDYE